MYTKDGSIDECYTAKHNDVIEFPRGYHTTVAAPGYNSYFLWMSAGEYQGFYRSYDSEHEWYAAAENMLKNSEADTVQTIGKFSQPVMAFKEDKYEIHYRTGKKAY